MDANQTIRKPKRSRLKRLILWTPAIIFMLIAILLLSTQTRPFKNWFRDYAVAQANETINGELTIGRLDGNLYKTVTLEDVTVRTGTDTLVAASSVYVRYDLFAMLGGVIQFDSIVIDSLHINLEQTADSTWNLARLIPEDTSASPLESVDEGSGYAVVINDFSLNSASVDVRSLNELIPDRIKDINLRLAAGFDSERQDLKLHNFSLRTGSPDFLVNRLSFEISLNSDSILLKDFELITAMNRIWASASFLPESPSLSTGRLVADSINIEEFREYIPEYIAAMDPLLRLNAELINDTLHTQLMVVHNDQALDLSVNAGAVSVFLDTNSTEPPGYNAEIIFQKIVLAEWLDKPELDIVLNGKTNLFGTGTEPENAEVNMRSDLKGTVVERIPIPVMNLNLAYDKGDIKGNVDIDGGFGQLELSGEVRNIFEAIAYRLKLDLTNFNIAGLALMDSLNTDLTLSVKTEGSGFNPDSLRGNLQFVIDPSNVNDLPIDSGIASIGFSREVLRVDTISIATPYGEVNLAGVVSLTDTSDLYYSLSLTDISPLTELAGAELLDARGTLTGRLSGTPGQLITQARIDFSDIVFNKTRAARFTGELEAEYLDSNLSFESFTTEKLGHIKARGQVGITDIFHDDIRVAKLTSEFEAEYRDSAPSITGWISAKGSGNNEVSLDSLLISVRYDRNRADISADFRDTAGFQASVTSRVDMDSLVTIFLQNLSLDYRSLHWAKGPEPAVITINDDLYTINNFKLISAVPNGNSEQSIQAEGTVNMSGESEISVVIRNLALEPLASEFELDLEGTFTTEIHVADSLTNPRLEGNFGISEGRYLAYRFERMNGDLDYNNGLANFKLNLIPTLLESLTVSGTVPYPIPAYDSIARPNTDSLIDVRIFTEKLSLEVLKTAGYTVENAGGNITCDLALTNTLKDPHLTGSLRVKNGNLSIPQYGLEYTGIEAGMSFQPNRLKLDSLVMLQNKGKLHLSGFLDYDSSLISGNISSSKIDLLTKDFYVVRHRHYEVQLTSAIGLNGTGTASTYGGTMTVNRSRFYLPALIAGMADTLNDASLPLLVAAVEPDKAIVADSVARTNNATATADSVRSIFMKNLRGSLKVNIPKNTWIKSPDLQMELSGDIEVVKKDLDFELFGNIKVVRGYYDLYGKRFKVKNGLINFQGGAEYNPNLDIEAEYILRTADREKKSLRLYATGTAQVPVLRFTLDDAELTEGDAVSYILFGRSLNELSHGQRSSVTGGSSTGEAAKGLAANLLAGQLTKALGRQLNLDVIEIKAEGDLQGAAIVIGKYLTPDLFMSYQRSFGSNTDNDLTPETVTLEYQLTRLFYLQLTEGNAAEAGFDIIMKLQKE